MTIYDGIERRQIISDGIFRGRVYRLKYRVMNIQGWSPYSDKKFVLAASKPSKPPTRAILYDVTANSITVNLESCVLSNGAPISSYNLYIKE